MSTKDEERARDQARAQAEHIAALVAALDCDYDRLEELRDERQALAEAVEDEVTENQAEAPRDGEVSETAVKALEAWDAEHDEELRELSEAAAAGESPEYALTSQDEARERIQESPLSVQVRSGWVDPGAEEFEPEEFEILLCTGGPAVRIRGELDGYGEPRRAWIEYQDWGTPWTEYHGEGCEQETLLTYCRCFYFGRG